jgi:hypothetical protein
MLVLMALIGGLLRSDVVAEQTASNQIGLEDSKLRGFTVTLALGEVDGGRSSGTFTPAATKALADLKDFLPYKSYRPLDTAWLLGLNGPHQVLQGQNGQKHEFYMRSTLLSPTAVKVDLLRLWDAPPTDSKSPVELLIDTNFKINVGETVAVGTSRVDSTKGLILLVTAAPR